MSTTEPTREERLAVIREREQQATKGPWESHACFDSTGYPVYSLHGVSGDDKRDYDQHVANAAFIAHARSDIPWLLDQLATREAQLREAVEKLFERGVLPRPPSPITDTRESLEAFAAGFFAARDAVLALLKGTDDGR